MELGVDAFYPAILGKREGIQGNFTTSSSKVSGQIITQQLGITSCQDNMHFGTQEPIDKEGPLLYILDFIQKDILEITINLIQYFEYVI